ncbi:endonuclease domain-containing protein [Aureitalea sp. L0-47]|uniref:endonuclease domain-containing protein n=1 Tax=Aureitalea sp. L0-47 TaxID=2816962 RepID=UPI0022379B0D|nr:endonuclease domain-containing protein [Aureitalea sp. L0-47]MCW5520588.1 endonuclease domain-containing protein [Aureitalea sp. L0-47]
MKTHNRRYLRSRRKEIRSNLTPAEAYLWHYLKSKQLCGRKFRRQHSILNFIVDFYCASEKLIIELDGQGHFTPNGEEYDKWRTKILEDKGFKVIRFENKIVFDLLPSVLAQIQAEFGE